MVVVYLFQQSSLLALIFMISYLIWISFSRFDLFYSSFYFRYLFSISYLSPMTVSNYSNSLSLRCVIFCIAICISVLIWYLPPETLFFSSSSFLSIRNIFYLTETRWPSESLRFESRCWFYRVSPSNLVLSSLICAPLYFIFDSDLSI